MTSKKILLISLNSPFELTGGGMYLRTLIDAFSSQGHLTLIAKDIKKNNSLKMCANFYFVGVRKNIISDVVSRCFLQPTFLFFYLFKIIKHAISHDVIIFHNSRNGIILSIMSFFLKKDVICCFDNVEYNVLSSTKASFLSKRIMNAMDKLIINFVEKKAYINSTACSFITESDKNFFVEKYGEKAISSIVIPVSIPEFEKIKHEELFSKKNPDRITLLFTASFDFPPNQKALMELLSVSDKFSDKYKLVVAGRSLNRFKENLYGRENKVFFYSDPSSDEMRDIFINASLYISPVSTGSGMKTKIAEALSFGLPIIASHHSIIGYEKIISNKVIMIYDDIEHLLHLLELFSEKKPTDALIQKNKALSCFYENYSSDAIKKIINTSSWPFFQL